MQKRPRNLSCEWEREIEREETGEGFFFFFTGLAARSIKEIERSSRVFQHHGAPWRDRLSLACILTRLRVVIGAAFHTGKTHNTLRYGRAPIRSHSSALSHIQYNVAALLPWSHRWHCVQPLPRFATPVSCADACSHAEHLPYAACKQCAAQMHCLRRSLYCVAWLKRGSNGPCSIQSSFATSACAHNLAN